MNQQQKSNVCAISCAYLQIDFAASNTSGNICDFVEVGAMKADISAPNTLLKLDPSPGDESLVVLSIEFTAFASLLCIATTVGCLV